MSHPDPEPKSPSPTRGCQKGCEQCACKGGASSQVEPHDELLRFAVSADELARRIWDGQGADLNHLIGDAIQSRQAPKAA
ncbi:MAG: hypothetical protein ACIARR_09815 [Phycisphaerales bacterium JB059]